MNYSDKIVQAISTITDETQLVTIANSNGVFKKMMLEIIKGFFCYCYCK
ncbi:MAG: hypothetical protein L6U99_11795 [Clostridium sp.]|nr:MAG: hypothetical protein L6U99_11795 [Clostridium sp.]